MTAIRRPVLLAALRLTVRSGLSGVWVRGELPPGPVVWAANHHSWWDPFVAAELITGMRRRAVLLVDAASLRRYRFARHIGAVGTDELRDGLAALRRGAVLVVYPEGRLLPSGPVGPLAPGAAWFAQQAPARLCPVAVRVRLRGGQFPEAHLVISEVGVSGPRAAVTRCLYDRLSQDLAVLDQLHQRVGAREQLPGLNRAVRGRRSWDERIDALRMVAPWQRR